MCGIAGVIGTTRAQGRHLLGPMLSEMSRRGPDAEDIEVWDHAALGHRRLSIFDLSDCGRQPMLTPDGHAGVVFNGAIYNFRALRADLRVADINFIVRVIPKSSYTVIQNGA